MKSNAVKIDEENDDFEIDEALLKLIKKQLELDKKLKALLMAASAGE